MNKELNWDKVVYEVHFCKPGTHTEILPRAYIQDDSMDEEQLKAKLQQLFRNMHAQGVECDFYVVRNSPEIKIIH